MQRIVGLTPKEITQTSDEIVMVFTNGAKARWYHDPDGYHVHITDVSGDWNDLVGSPLLVAEERVDHSGIDEVSLDASTWAFYTFRSIRGSVDARWYGSSGAYYSDSVDFEFTGQN